MSTQDKTSLTRRHFIKSSGLAVAGTATGGLLLNSQEARASCDAMPQKWDESVDVVIIGSGFAGLAAAYEAKKAGASVVVLEKMRTAGGNSIINGGIIAAAGSPMQAARGIKDSTDQLVKDMLEAGNGLNHPELVRLIASQSVPTVQWTVDEFGVKYSETKLAHEGGHAVPRSYATHNSSGSAIIQPMLEKLKGMGIEPRLQTYVQKILRDENGRVKGIEVRENYSRNKPDAGKVKTIKANKALILSHGGFGVDVAYRMIQDPKLTDKFDTTNQPGATAELWRESARIGCNIIQADWIQVAPWCSPDEKGFGIALFFSQGAAAMFGVWIDAKTGKRFINELANRKVRADAIMALLNEGHECLAISDANGPHQLAPGMLEKQLERGVVKTYKTLEEVAAAYNVPLETFLETIKNYNKFVAQKKDETFDRYMNEKCLPIEKAPFYVARLQPKLRHCMGGIHITTEAQAIDVSTGKPIPGLYAAGESTGGVHGAVRLGSCAAMDCLVMGRIAGKNAAAEKAWG